MLLFIWLVSERARRISTGEYVENGEGARFLKRLFEILNAGVDLQTVQ